MYWTAQRAGAGVKLLIIIKRKCFFRFIYTNRKVWHKIKILKLDMKMTYNYIISYFPTPTRGRNLKSRWSNQPLFSYTFFMSINTHISKIILNVYLIFLGKKNTPFYIIYFNYDMYHTYNSNTGWPRGGVTFFEADHLEFESHQHCHNYIWKNYTLN